MPFSANDILNDILLGFVLPALFACGTFAVLSRAKPESALSRFGPSVGLVGGFLLGYFLLKLGPPVPESHWQWLPYAMLLPLVVGPVSQAGGVTWFERVLLYVLVAAIAGWWLVPTWEDLEPSRIVHLGFFALLVVGLTILLEPLSRRLSGGLFAAVLFFTMVFGAGVLIYSGSLRFGQIAGAGAGALAGLAVGCWFRRDAGSLPGLALGFALFSSGTLLVGRVTSFSEVPLASYLLIPLAPLSLAVFACGPLSRLEGAKRTLPAIGLPMIIALVAIALAHASEG